MLSHCRARHISNTTAQQAPTAQTAVPTSSRTNAVLAQSRGFAHFTGLSTARRTVSLPSMSRSSSNTPAATTPTTPVSGSTPLTPILTNLTALSAPASVLNEAEKAALEAEERVRDLHSVRNELHRYKEEPLFAENVPLDLVSYWDVSLTEDLLAYTLKLCNRNRKGPFPLPSK
jgi:hypothetical protein